MSVQRIRAIAGLQRHLRDFVEQYLLGHVRIDDLVFRELEKETKIPGRRQLHREKIGVDFGDFSLTIESPVERPPLGWILLFDRKTGEMEEGVIDAATWRRIGKTIKERSQCHLMTQAESR